MDSSGNFAMHNNIHRWQMESRRLRLISDMMEDYQDNMRRAFRLIGCELGISNNVLTSQTNTANTNVDDWMDRVYQTTTNVFSTAENTTPVPETPSFSFNNSPPLTRNDGRRAFIYTQLLEPRRSSDTGITNEQIENSTQVITYDSSMNESRCPITWDQFEPGQNILRINRCGHIFGQPALTQWFQRHSVCPVCRASVLQNNTSPTTPAENIPDTTSQSSSTQAPSNAINQIVSSILNGVNGAVNTDNGYYESEFSFNMDDLLSAYTQLVGSQPTPNRSNTNSRS